MEDRRSFVMKIAGGMAAAGFLVGPAKVQANSNQLRKLFVHHVLFWLNDPDIDEARKDFEKGLQELIKIPLIQTCHIGTPVQSPRDVVDDSFTYSYIAFFGSKEDQDIYQTHPIHLKFIADCQHLWNKVVVYDAMD
jgi:hypothetical protein